ncbi:MAG: RNA ligase [Pseudomonadota bacterium]|nr:MAG: RNA ligase [Pseudomonadota bacterium]
MNLGEPQLQEAIAKRKAIWTDFADIRYLRFSDQCRDVLRGTVVVDDRVIHGYPRIGRILALGRGLSEQFSAPFWAEEKVDGYNVRICRIGGRTIAITRGGYICPFTTDRIVDFIDSSVFDKDPDLVICAEVAGPDNPYVESCPQFIDSDIELFVFDLMYLDRSGFIPHADKYRCIESYELPAVRCLGRFTTADLGKIRETLRRFNEEGREGLVFKEDTPERRCTKYVTSNSSIADIRSTAENILELPPEYFTSRILRLALFLREQGLEHSAGLDRQLGAAFLDGLLAAIAQYEQDGKAHHRFRCRFRQRDSALALLAHLSDVARHKARITRRDLRQDGEHWVLEYDRTYPSLNTLLGNLLKGGQMYD